MKNIFLGQFQHFNAFVRVCKRSRGLLVMAIFSSIGDIIEDFKCATKEFQTKIVGIPLDFPLSSIYRI